MRGKEFDWMPNADAAGITPAHAGKSRPMTAPLRGGSDHPRPCGEKFCGGGGFTT